MKKSQHALAFKASHLAMATDKVVVLLLDNWCPDTISNDQLAKAIAEYKVKCNSPSLISSTNV